MEPSSQPQNSPALPETTPAPKRASLGAIVATLVQELVLTFLPALVLALLINHFVAQTTYVLGQSMEPNLHDDQHLLIEKVTYRFGEPERGDVIVIDVDHAEIPLIKRVIGLPGETVEIRASQLFIDGQPIDEPYLSGVLQRDYGPTTVPEDHVFVMGDNRNNSNDSRYFGAVPLDKVLGRAWVSYWPLQDAGLVN